MEAHARDGTLRLVRSVPCGNCKGKGRVFSPTFQIGDGAKVHGTKCPTCNGRGTTEAPVSCAGCEFHDTVSGAPYCFHFRSQVTESFGCLSWQPKEES